MLEFTHLAATESVDHHNGNRSTRVYYQNEDGRIKESCYDKNGWYTTGADVVVKAKKNTPIAVASWDNGSLIRLYYFDENNKIREQCGDAGHRRGTTWKDGHVFDEITVLPESRLAIARAGQADTVIRVFFQLPDGSIGEMMYKKDDNRWTKTKTKFPRACPGSCLYAVSAKPPGDVRLYYQGVDNEIKEHFHPANKVWKAANIGVSLALSPAASFSVVSWGYDKNPADLHISIFAVGSDSQLIRLAYGQQDGWASTPIPYINVFTGNISNSSIPAGNGAVVAVRTPGNRGNETITVFCQSEPNVIAQYDVTEGKRVPLGVPTFLDSESSDDTPGDIGDNEVDALNDQITELNIQLDGAAADKMRLEEEKEELKVKVLRYLEKTELEFKRALSNANRQLSYIEFDIRGTSREEMRRVMGNSPENWESLWRDGIHYEDGLRNLKTSVEANLDALALLRNSLD